jgi:hypothetical protein
MEFDRLTEGKTFHFKKIAHQTFLVQSNEDYWIIYQKKIHNRLIWTCADESIPEQLLEILSHFLEDHLKNATRNRDER